MNSHAQNAATIGKSFDRELTLNAETLSDNYEPTDWTTPNPPVLAYRVAFYEANTGTLLYFPTIFRQMENESISLPNGKYEVDSLERFSGLDLEYYKQQIPPEQLRLLMDMVGVEIAPKDFDSTKTWYPEEL